MAEEDFDNDDLLDDEDLDEIDEDQDIAAGSGGRFSGLLTRKRIIIGAAVLGGVVLITSLTLTLMPSGKSVSKAGNVQNQLTQATQAAIQQENDKKAAEEKKRKKKIKYEELFNQLTDEQVTPIVRELSIREIPFQIEQKGNVFALLVDRNQVQKARIILAMKGLPAGGSKGFELLDESATLGVTEFDKRVRFLRALSGELEKTIIQMDAIERAKVQIVLPEERLFSVTRPPVTASILIRAAAGFEISDTIVYGIIQLISKSVENLQPENVTVVDTNGTVMSVGIFERIADLAFEEEEVFDEVVEGEGVGIAILPDMATIKNWLQVKKEFETDLENKAIKQLLGVLPLGSFKLAITSDIGAIEEGNSFDIKRLTVSVVIDNNNEDIYLDDFLKEEIFNTVAPAIGYVRGRDTIELSRADFLTFSDAEMARLKRLSKTGSNGLVSWLIRLLILGVAGYGVFYLIRRIRRGRVSSNITIGSGPLPESEIDDNTNFDLAIDNQQGIERLRDLASTNPESIATIIEEWVSGQTSGVGQSENREEVNA